MNQQEVDDNPFGALRRHWAESSKKDVDLTSPEEKEVLQKSRELLLSLYQLGWREISSHPKDNKPFKSLTLGSLKASYTKYHGSLGGGCFMVEEAGDLWPCHPLLWKPMDSKP